MITDGSLRPVFMMCSPARWLVSQIVLLLREVRACNPECGHTTSILQVYAPPEQVSGLHTAQSRGCTSLRATRVEYIGFTDAAKAARSGPWPTAGDAREAQYILKDRMKSLAPS